MPSKNPMEIVKFTMDALDLMMVRSGSLAVCVCVFVCCCSHASRITHMWRVRWRCEVFMRFRAIWQPLYCTRTESNGTECKSQMIEKQSFAVASGRKTFEQFALGKYSLRYAFCVPSYKCLCTEFIRECALRSKLYIMDNKKHRSQYVSILLSVGLPLIASQWAFITSLSLFMFNYGHFISTFNFLRITGKVGNRRQTPNENKSKRQPLQADRAEPNQKN